MEDILKIPENLDEWVEKQLQDPEVLQRELLKLQEENETLKKRIKTLLDELKDVIPHNGTTKPLQPFVESAKQEYVLLEHYEKGWFSERETKLTVQYKTGKRIYAVYQERKGLFAKTASKTFDTFEVAIRFFNKVTL